jgi:hypothetical protein
MHSLLFLLPILSTLFLLLSSKPIHSSTACYKPVDDADFSSPISLLEREKFSLRYKADETNQEFHIILAAKPTIGWMGFGLPEQTSAGMLGTDIVTTVIVGTQAPQVDDRFVPWTSWPFAPYQDYFKVSLTESIATTPGPFPQKDCENNGTADWVAVAGFKNTTCYVIRLKRKFVTNDPNDRPVPRGHVKFLWAISNSTTVAYHGVNRGTAGATFRALTDTPAYVKFDPSQCTNCFTRDYTFGGYKIPRQTTAYSCRTFALNTTITEIANRQNVYIVGFEPIIAEATKPNVHHMVAFGCPGSAAYPDSKYFTPNLCNVVGTPQNCFSMLYGWGVGAGPLMLPQGVAYTLGSHLDGFQNQTHSFWIQMHYTNVEELDNLYDYSGIRFHLSHDKPVYEAAAMLTGLQQLVWDPLDGGLNETHRQVSCPSGCTAAFKSEINVFGSFLHMHTFGKSIWSALYDSNGNFKHYGNVIEYWSFENQQITEVAYKISKGDRLQLHGIYDTSKYGKQVSFNEQSFDEMLLEILFYYPAQFHPVFNNMPFFDCGSYWNSTDNSTQTECTNFKLPKSYLEEIKDYLATPPETFYQTHDPITKVGATISNSFGKPLYVKPSCPSGQVPTAEAGPSTDSNYDFTMTIAGNRIWWKVISSTRSIKAKIVGPSTGWVGFGINDPSIDTGNKMVGSNAIIGGHDGATSCGVFHLGGTSASLISEIISKSGLISCTSSVEGDSRIILFEAQHIGGLDFFGGVLDSNNKGRRRRRTDTGTTTLSTSVTVISARGDPNGGSFSQHVEAAYAGVNFDLGTSNSQDLLLKQTMRTAHAFLMMIAFAVIAPLGILTPATFKPMKDKSPIPWLFVHKGLMLSAVGIGWVAFALALASTAEHFSKPHHLIGLVVMILFSINPVLGFLRPHAPKPGAVATRKRMVWEIIHKSFGRSAYTLAFCNVVVGATMMRDGLSVPFDTLAAVIFITIAGICAIVCIPVYLFIKIRNNYFGKFTSGSNNVDEEKGGGGGVVVNNNR